MSELKIALVHAGQREDVAVTTGTKAWEPFKDTPDVIAARVNGQLKDLSYELADGDEVEGVAIDSRDGHDSLRRSTAHLSVKHFSPLRKSFSPSRRHRRHLASRLRAMSGSLP